MPYASRFAPLWLATRLLQARNLFETVGLHLHRLKPATSIHKLHTHTYNPAADDACSRSDWLIMADTSRQPRSPSAWAILPTWECTLYAYQSSTADPVPTLLTGIRRGGGLPWNLSNSELSPTWVSSSNTYKTYLSVPDSMWFHIREGGETHHQQYKKTGTD